MIKSENRTTRGNLILMLLGGFATVGGILLVGIVFEFVPDSWRWFNEPVHSTIEAIGALAAVVMGAILVRQRSETGDGHLFLPGLGLIGMGILDGFHAACSPGEAFVFLHSLAGLSGGIGFVLVWRSHQMSRSRWTKNLPWILAVVAVIIGIVSVAMREFPFAMLHNDKFSSTTVSINHLGGLLFLLSSLSFCRDFIKSGSNDDYRFFLLAILFGLAGVTFTFSSFWDYQWWMRLLLRLFAYILTLSILLRAYQKAIQKISESKESLAEETKKLDKTNMALTEESEKLELTYLALSEEKINLEMVNAALDEETNKLERANSDLVLRNRELDEFTYVASHDLQEPLRKMISFCTLLEMDLGDDIHSQVQKDMDYIKDAALRMQRLVQDLLALSRAGRSAMKREKVTLTSCAERALNALSTRVEETDALITQDPLPVIWGDPTVITQLYQNLIGNALKFIPDDTRPEIHLSNEEINGETVFGVRDNGIGMKPEYTEQIFIPFKRLHGREKYEGTGIGLAICRKAVERHGGRIWAESEHGKGSHFRFTIAQRKHERENVKKGRNHAENRSKTSNNFIS